MELCSHNHDEIAFEGNKCPMCAMIDEKDEKIRELKEEIENLEDAKKSLEFVAEQYKIDWQNAQKEVERLINGKEDGER